MKKRILSSIILTAITAAAIAQPLSTNVESNAKKQVTKFLDPNGMQAKTECVTDNISKMHSTLSYKNASTRANGVSYLRPEGTFWIGFGPNFENSYAENMLYAPAYTSIKFTNNSDNPSATKWSINGTDLSNYVENNNLLFTYSTNNEEQYFYLPELRSGNTTFRLGETNEEYGSGLVTNGNSQTILASSEITNIFGTFTNKSYIFGTTEKLENGSKMYSTILVFEKPAATLCVSDIQYPMVSNSETYLPEGVSLTLKIKKAVPNGEGVLLPSDEVLYEIKADKNDFTNGFQFPDNGLKTNWLKFSNKEFNQITQTMEAIPFVLDEPFALELCGFNQEGVDLGLMALKVVEGEIAPYSYMLFEGEPDTYYYARAVEPVNAFAMITAYYNGIRISENTTSLKAPDTGGYAVTDDNNALDYVRVTTTAEWLEEYDFVYENEKPGWITVEIDNSDRLEKGYYSLHFECDPLPADIKSRHWTTRIKGFGDALSDRSFTIYQGEKPVGIENATAANNDISIVSNKDSYDIFYPETVTKVTIVNVAGQTIAMYDLPIGGKFTIPASELNSGLYLLKFNNNQTVKVIK